MSENKHTPEPWAVSVEIFDNDGVPETAIQALNRSATVAVALDFGLNNPSMREANARRIVACVNACAGSTTEWLEFIISKECIDMLGGPRPFETRHTEVLREALRIMGERNTAEKQRDELLAALEKIGGFALPQFMGPHDMALACVETARAAIDSVKGGAA